MCVCALAMEELLAMKALSPQPQPRPTPPAAPPAAAMAPSRAIQPPQHQRLDNVSRRPALSR